MDFHSSPAAAAAAAAVPPLAPFLNHAKLLDENFGHLFWKQPPPFPPLLCCLCCCCCCCCCSPPSPQSSSALKKVVVVAQSSSWRPPPFAYQLQLQQQHQPIPYHFHWWTFFVRQQQQQSLLEPLSWRWSSLTCSGSNCEDHHLLFLQPLSDCCSELCRFDFDRSWDWSWPYSSSCRGSSERPGESPSTSRRRWWGSCRCWSSLEKNKFRDLEIEQKSSFFIFLFYVLTKPSDHRVAEIGHEDAPLRTDSGENVENEEGHPVKKKVDKKWAN